MFRFFSARPRNSLAPTLRSSSRRIHPIPLKLLLSPLNSCSQLFLPRPTTGEMRQQSRDLIVEPECLLLHKVRSGKGGGVLNTELLRQPVDPQDTTELYVSGYDKS
jgi:hypothetical protein